MIAAESRKFDGELAVDPGIRRDQPTDTADIRNAVRMRQAAQAMVEAAVRDARAAGVTWVEFGLALSISPQGALQHYS